MHAWSRVLLCACLVMQCSAYPAAVGWQHTHQPRARSTVTCAAADMLPPLRRPRLCNMTRAEGMEMRRLSARVQTLENAISALCSSIVFADDVALSERTAHGIGDVYLDASLSNSRKTRLLRVGVMTLASEHGIRIVPPPTHWHKRDIIAEIGRVES